MGENLEKLKKYSQRMLEASSCVGILAMYCRRVDSTIHVNSSRKTWSLNELCHFLSLPNLQPTVCLHRRYIFFPTTYSIIARVCLFALDFRESTLSSLLLMVGALVHVLVSALNTYVYGMFQLCISLTLMCGRKLDASNTKSYAPSPFFQSNQSPAFFV